MNRLVEEGQVAKNWDKQKYNGIAQDSVVVLAVRKGNPKGIHSFNDLLSKKVSIVTPNPFSSGSARWNIMAVYGSEIEQGKSPAQALEAVKTVLEKTRASRAAAATRSPPSRRARATSCSPTRTKRSKRKKKAKTSNTSSRHTRSRSKRRSR